MVGVALIVIESRGRWAGMIGSRPSQPNSAPSACEANVGPIPRFPEKSR